MKTTRLRPCFAACVTALALPAAPLVAGEAFEKLLVGRAAVLAAKLESAVFPTRAKAIPQNDLEAIYKKASREDKLLIALHMILEDRLDGERASNFRVMIKDDVADLRKMLTDLDQSGLRKYVEVHYDWMSFRTAIKHLLGVDLAK